MWDFFLSVMDKAADMIDKDKIIQLTASILVSAGAIIALWKGVKWGAKKTVGKGLHALTDLLRGGEQVMRLILESDSAKLIERGEYPNHKSRFHEVFVVLLDLTPEERAEVSKSFVLMPDPCNPKKKGYMIPPSDELENDKIHTRKDGLKDLLARRIAERTPDATCLGRSVIDTGIAGVGSYGGPSGKVTIDVAQTMRKIRQSHKESANEDRWDMVGDMKVGAIFEWKITGVTRRVVKVSSSRVACLPNFPDAESCCPCTIIGLAHVLVPKSAVMRLVGFDQQVADQDHGLVKSNPIPEPVAKAKKQI